MDEPTEFAKLTAAGDRVAVDIMPHVDQARSNREDWRAMLWVSQYNQLPEVMPDSPAGKNLRLYDTTLRDGEQTVGVSLSRFAKLEIATMLAEAGVERIEAGMPIVSKEDAEAVRLIVDNVRGAEIWGFCRCVKADIDACAETGVKHVVCEMPTSDLKFKAYGFDPEAVIGRVVEHLQYAKQKGMYTAFFAVDATRSSLEYLREAYQKAVKDGGADEVVLVDTLGVATPETLTYLTQQVREWVDVPVAVHCHNDFGLGVACTLAAMKAGASYAHVTVNGLGEKTGNSDLAETVLAGKSLYGFSSNIDFSKLIPLGRRVADLSGVPVSPLKPVVGTNVFKRESGIVISQLGTYPPAVEGYSPELVGAKREVVLGKKSGKASIQYVLRERGVEASPEEVAQILEAVKKLGLEKRGLVTDDEFDVIVRTVFAASRSASNVDDLVVTQ